MIKLEEALQTLKIPYTPQMLAQFAAYRRLQEQRSLWS